MFWGLSPLPPTQRLLALANAAAVGSLYLNQALLTSAAVSLPVSTWLALVPFATLAGYASGVALVAFGPARRRFSVPRHLGVLAIALAAAAAAPTIPALTLASFCVGLGAATAQRLLAAAAHLAGSAAAGRAIGRLIACGLFAVLLVKLLGAAAAGLVGWRGVFALAALLVAVAAFLVRPPAASAQPVLQHPGVAAFWRSSSLLRRVAWQQAALFGAFQAAWLIALTALAPEDRWLVAVGGGCAGMLAAVGAGWHSDRGDQGRVAAIGSAAMVVSAALALPFAYGMASGWARSVLLLVGMAGIDGGLQVALVANQARAQAIRPELRSRCAALLTVFGSLGGGAAAGSACWLYGQFGGAVAVLLAAALACTGLLLSMWPLPLLARQNSIINFAR